MVVGVLRLSLHFHEAQSLKAKRGPLRKLIAQVKNRFGVAVAEVGDQDKWQVAEVGVATVGSSAPVINAVLDQVLNFVDRLGAAELRDHQIEIIHL
jgi:uncharacterized protein YlxP (DUF503 family)